jgi:pyrroloquinoline quinone (PQQ) biosynthesis protein C
MDQDTSQILRSMSERSLPVGPPLKASASLPHTDSTESSGSEASLRFVQSLAKQAESHRAVNHPYLIALASGEVRDLRWALADFARHYYGYSAHFRRYLAVVISRLPAPEDQEPLIQNLTEESGQYSIDDLEELRAQGIEPSWIVGIPHPLLFQRFSKAMGLNQEATKEAIEVACWREMFMSLLSNGSPAEAVGALGLGTEGVVQKMYKYFVEAIGRIENLAPEDTVFFPLHTAVDDHHQATLQQIAAKFCCTVEGRREVCMGMRKALALRDTFWNWLLERARSTAPPEDCLA